MQMRTPAASTRRGLAPPGNLCGMPKRQRPSSSQTRVESIAAVPVPVFPLFSGRYMAPFGQRAWRWIMTNKTEQTGQIVVTAAPACAFT